MDTKYFDGKISHGFVSLYSSKIFIRVAVGLLGIFIPIFLYESLDKNFTYVAIYYLAGFFLYTITVAFGAQFFNKFGFRRALQLGSVWGALFFTIFYFINDNNLYLMLGLSIIVLTLFRNFHWLPYHVDFAKFSDSENRSRQVSLLEATTNIIGVITPIAAGFIIYKFGFGFLFLMAIFLYLASLIPLITIPRTREKFVWGYWETWKKVFSKEFRKKSLAFAADGAEMTVSAVVWPIFIFELLKGNFIEVGAISSLVIGVTVVLQLVAGKYIDKKFTKEKVLKYGTILYAFGWIFKIFIATAFQIFIVDFYHRVAGIFAKTPYMTLTYDLAADEGHYVDEFTVLHEVSINGGKVIMMVLVIVIAANFSLTWTFVLAAGASILLNLIKPDGFHRVRKA
jgi:MFS family permease